MPTTACVRRSVLQTDRPACSKAGGGVPNGWVAGRTEATLVLAFISIAKGFDTHRRIGNCACVYPLFLFVFFYFVMVEGRGWGEF